MKMNFPEVLKHIIDFLEVKVNEDHFNKLLNHLSFDSMKKNLALVREDAYYGNPCDSGSLLIRAGKVGDYKNFMTEELIRKFDQWTLENIKNTGLKFLDFN